MAADPVEIVAAHGEDAFASLDRLTPGWWVGFLTYDLEGATQTVEPEYMFPILPTLGVRVEF